MKYREIKPAAVLQPYIISYWLFQVHSLVVTGENEIEHLVPADGCVSLFFCYQQRTGIRRAQVIGPTVTNIITKVQPDSIYVGVRFFPGMFHAIFGKDPSLLNPYTTLVTDFLLVSDVELLLQSLELSFDNFNLFDQVFIRLFSKQKIKPDSEVIKAAATIIQAGGNISIKHILQEAAISERPLQKRFRLKTGITMKELARVCRFRNVTIKLLLYQEEYYDTIYQAGYFDQAHFIHDVTRTAGRKLLAFERYIKQIEHVAVKPYHQISRPENAGFLQ